MSNYITTKSGVKVYKDWHDNIIINKDNSLIASQSAKSYYRGLAKGLSRLGSENSEDAMTWNIFRTLQDIPASLWLHTIVQPMPDDADTAILHFWKHYAPPPTYPQAEGKSEVDLAIETDSALIYIEAKLHSKISQPKTKRNQVIRNIDVGSYHAGQMGKDFYFCLLTPISHQTNLVTRYQDTFILEDELAHRTDDIDVDGLSERIFHIHWETIIDLLRDSTFQGKAGQTFDALLSWVGDKLA